MFRLLPEDQGKKISVYFDGVYENSEVWINGHSLGVRPYGYISFQHDLTPHLKFGEDNVLAVRVDNSVQPNSRWYTGCGIYRLVHLTITDPLHVKQWGTAVTTPQISDARARVRVQTEVQNDFPQARDCTLVTRILDPQNKIVAEAQAAQTLPAQSEFRFEQEIDVPQPQRWSPATPRLYRVQTLVKAGQKICDEYATNFGIREARFDKDQGFLLNGVRMELKGVCLHHDVGSLGTAAPARAWERRLAV